MYTLTYGKYLMSIQNGKAINGKNILGIAGFKNYFAIWFYKGAFLKDENKQLISANEGVTKSLRQWRFTSAAAVDEKIVLQYVDEAIAYAIDN